MRILIVSDLHANMDAVRALPSDCRQMWVLGDLVNYGPDPAEVIAFIRDRGAVVVRGNHDHAIGIDGDPRCSERFRAMADETGRYTRATLSAEDLRYLRGLPLKATIEAAFQRVSMCHATPPDPLFEYRRGDSPLWLVDEAGSPVDLQFVGHTHIPFRRFLKSRVVVNPGSVGQPKHGRPEASYAVWEDGRVRLGSAPYDVEAVIQRLRRLSFSEAVFDDLAFVLRNGTAPAPSA